MVLGICDLEFLSMELNKKLQPFLGAIMVFMGAVCFSAKAVTVKMAYRYGADPMSLLALRMLLSCPIYIVILWYFNKKYPHQEDVSAKQWFWILFLGIVGYYGASYFDFTGLKYITAGLERLILFIYPTIVVLLSSVLFKRPITRKQIIALFFTYGGVALAVVHDLKVAEGNTLLGGILIFLSAVTYAMYLIGSEKLIPLLGTVRFTCYAMIVSTIAVLLHYLITEDMQVLHQTPEVYGLALFMAIFSTVIPSFFISEGIRMIGSGSASIIGSIGPVSTIFLAYVFLGEEVSLYQVIGTVLVLAGILIVSKK